MNRKSDINYASSSMVSNTTLNNFKQKRSNKEKKRGDHLRNSNSNSNSNSIISFVFNYEILNQIQIYEIKQWNSNNNNNLSTSMLKNDNTTLGYTFKNNDTETLFLHKILM
jgi:hypothetical protein